MTDPNLPNDPRFSPPPPPPAAPVQPPVAPPQAPQNPAFQTPPPPAPPAPTIPPVQPPQQTFAQQPPVAPPGYQPSPPNFGTPPPSVDPPQPQMLQTGDSGGATVQDQIEKKPSIGGRIGLVAAALAVAGGGAFAVTRALEEPAGPATADEAVTQLFEAVENDDLIGLTEVMLPSEREALVDPMIDLFTELERLEILDEDVDLEARADEAGSDGIDFSVTGLDYTTTVVGEGVVNVQLTAGVVSVAGDVGDLPFGDRASAEIGEENMTESIDEQIFDFSEEQDARITVVEEDGSWYVSLWYSAAEAIREEAGEPAPNFGAGVVPVGGETPEDALRTMIESAVDLDAEAVIATMDPSEFRSLHDYAPLFLDEIDEAAAEFRQMLDEEGVTYSLDRLDLSSADVRGRTVVSVDGFAGSASADGERFSFDFDGNCLTVIVDSEIDEVCLDDFRDEMAGEELPEAYLDLVTDSNSGVTVVERDGLWYVSGFPTIIGAYADFLAALEPSDIDDLAGFFGGSFEDAFELSDPLFDELTGSNDPFFEEDFLPVEPDEDPFFETEEDFDPFAEDEAELDESDFDDEFLEPELAAEDLALYPADWIVFANNTNFAYFAGEVGIPAVSYTTGYVDFGPSILVERFDATADELNAGMANASPYVQVEVEGLPDGATAYDWEDVDRAVVIDGFIISAYFEDDGSAMALLTERVNVIANS